MKRCYVFGLGGLILALALVGCPQPTDESSSTPRSTFGETLKLSGQVYTLTGAYTKVTDSTKDRPLSDNLLVPGHGAIENGRLSYEVGPQDPLTPLSDFIPTYYPANYNNVQVSPDTSCFELLELDSVSKKKTVASISPVTFTTETISYIYVDADANIKGEGKSLELGGVQIKTNNIHLKLKKGWNAIHKKETAGADGDITVSLKLANPNLYWVVE